MRTLIIVRTHRADAAALQAYDLYSRAPGADVVFCVDQRAGPVDMLGRAAIGYDDATLAQLGLYAHPNAGWRCGDYCYHAVRAARPDYDLYWLVEPDVRINVADPPGFFARYAGHPADLLAARFGVRDEVWHWTHMIVPTGMAPQGCIYPITRLSGRAIDELHAARRALSADPAYATPDRWPNDESFTASVLVARGLHCADLNDAGPQCYTRRTLGVGVTWDEAAIPAAPRDGLIYHSVRPFAPLLDRAEARVAGFSLARSASMRPARSHGDAMYFTSTAETLLRHPDHVQAALVPLMLSEALWRTRPWAARGPARQAGDSQGEAGQDGAGQDAGGHAGGSQDDGSQVGDSQGRSGHASCGQGKTGRDGAGQDGAGQSRAGQDVGSRDGAGQGWAANQGGGTRPDTDARALAVAQVKLARAFGVRPARQPAGTACLASLRAPAVPGSVPDPADFELGAPFPLARFPAEIALPYACDLTAGALLFTLHVAPWHVLAAPDLRRAQGEAASAAAWLDLASAARLHSAAAPEAEPLFVVVLGQPDTAQLDAALRLVSPRVVAAPGVLDQLAAVASDAERPAPRQLAGMLRAAVAPWGRVRLPGGADGRSVVRLSAEAAGLAGALGTAFPRAAWLFAVSPPHDWDCALVEATPVRAVRELLAGVQALRRLTRIGARLRVVSARALLADPAAAMTGPADPPAGTGRAGGAVAKDVPADPGRGLAAPHGRAAHGEDGPALPAAAPHAPPMAGAGGPDRQAASTPLVARRSPEQAAAWRARFERLWSAQRPHAMLQELALDL